MSGKKNKAKQGITLISLLCVTVLLVVAYFIYSDQKHKKEISNAADDKEKEEASIQVNNDDASQYASITIQSTEPDSSVELTQTDKEWHLEDDKDFPLDKEKVSDLVDNLAKLLVKKTVVESAEDLNEFGLGKPSTIVTVRRQDGSELTLNIGDKLGVNTDYYVSFDDKKTVYELPDSTSKCFMVKKEDLFYTPDNLSLTEGQIKELQLSTKTQGSFHIVYDEDNPYDYTGLHKFHWYSPDQSRNPVNVDDLSVSNITSKYLSFSIEKGVGYGNEAMKNYGLEDPEGMIYLRYSDVKDPTKETEMTLHIGSQDEYGNYYVSYDDNKVVYLMQESQLSEKLACKQADLIDPCISLINISYVSNFKITTDKINDSYDIETADDSDKNAAQSALFKKNGEKCDDSSAVRKLYTKLISISRNKFLPPDTTVTGSPVLTIHFTFTSGKELEVCYYSYDENSYAVTLNKEVQSTVDKKQVDDIVKDL